jgi:hypothetical protein
MVMLQGTNPSARCQLGHLLPSGGPNLHQPLHAGQKWSTGKEQHRGWKRRCGGRIVAGKRERCRRTDCFSLACRWGRWHCCAGAPQRSQRRAACSPMRPYHFAQETAVTIYGRTTTTINPDGGTANIMGGLRGPDSRTGSHIPHGIAAPLWLALQVSRAACSS